MCGKVFRSGQFREDVVKSIIHNSMKNMDTTDLVDTPGEVKPGDKISGVDGLGRIITARWGFDNDMYGGLVYNTRCEKLSGKWWAKFHTIRLSVPVSSFYERDACFAGKRPVVWLAAISDGQHTSLLTADALGEVKKYHHRMPLTLADTTIDNWLAGEIPLPGLVHHID